MKASDIEVKDSYVLMYTENDFEYYDFNGYKQNGKWGFVNKSGQTVVECIYDMVTEINEYGYAGIKKDGKWGSIDANGQVVQEPIYELEDIQPTFIGKLYKIESWTGESCYSDNQVQQEANNEVSNQNEETNIENNKEIED